MGMGCFLLLLGRKFIATLRSLFQLYRPRANRMVDLLGLRRGGGLWNGGRGSIAPVGCVWLLLDEVRLQRLRLIQRECLILFSESLDELTQLVTTLFAPIQNRGREPWPMVTDSPFGPEQHGVSYFICFRILLNPPTECHRGKNRNGLPCL